MTPKCSSTSYSFPNHLFLTQILSHSFPSSSLRPSFHPLFSSLKSILFLASANFRHVRIMVSLLIDTLNVSDGMDTQHKYFQFDELVKEFLSNRIRIVEKEAERKIKQDFNFITSQKCCPNINHHPPPSLVKSLSSIRPEGKPAS